MPRSRPSYFNSLTKPLYTVVFALLAGATAASQVRDAVTFDGEPKALYAPAREVASGLNIALRYDADSDLAFLGEIVLDHTLQSPSGERWVRLGDLKRIGVVVHYADVTSLTFGGNRLAYRRSAKRVELDKATQTLRAYQGERLVMESRVSTGRYERSTPNGQFVAGLKDRYHASSLYDDAPMPWAVQVSGNVFVHGYRIVPLHPASHGCVRMPMNAAEWFFRWVERGTPITISGRWRAVGTLDS